MLTRTIKYKCQKCECYGTFRSKFLSQQDYNEFQTGVDKGFYKYVCSDCKAAAGKEAGEEATSLGLPKLYGTEKQISWANQIRKEILNADKCFCEKIINDVILSGSVYLNFCQDELMEVKNNKGNIGVLNYIATFDKNMAVMIAKIIFFSQTTFARKIIDCKDILYNKWFELIPDSYIFPFEKKSKEEVEDISKELIIKPSGQIVNPNLPICVNINEENKSVTATYISDKSFSQICNKNGFKFWDIYKSYIFHNDQREYNLDDVASTLTISFIENGYIVKVNRKETFEKVLNCEKIIIDKDYVYFDSLRKVLYVCPTFGDGKYESSKRFKKIKYNDGLLETSLENYNEMLEFAKSNYLDITNESLEAINNYRFNKEEPYLEVDFIKILKKNKAQKQKLDLQKEKSKEKAKVERELKIEAETLEALTDD